MSSLCDRPGCIFENRGRIPDSAVQPQKALSPVEDAVYKNNVPLLTSLLQTGESISVEDRIGHMTCYEFACFNGSPAILSLLIQNSSSCHFVKQYFAFEDMADRAQLISRNKETFFGNKAAMAQINRYIACLYTCIVYNKPTCLSVLMDVLGKYDLLEVKFNVGPRKLNSLQLADSLDQKECVEILKAKIGSLGEAT